MTPPPARRLVTAVNSAQGGDGLVQTNFCPERAMSLPQSSLFLTPEKWSADRMFFKGLCSDAEVAGVTVLPLRAGVVWHYHFHH